MSTLKLTVAILGGGMAGNLLARQLRGVLPEAQIGLFEKSTEPAYKLGESMVELASNYFVRKLGLSSYLYDRHYPKNGLRFFFDDSKRSAELEEMSELGSQSLPFFPAFQIDRATLDADLAAMNAERGVLVRTGVRARDLVLGSGGEPHRFKIVDGERETDVEARWVVDATGRSRVIAKQKRLHVREPELMNAAVWGRFEGVEDIDALGSDAFQRRVRHTARRLSTLHFMYPGYWIWFIPLRGGITSVGLVSDSSVYRPELRTEQGFLDFLRGHKAVATLLERAKPVDLGAYTQLSYGTRQFVSLDRWALVGEAATFSDPFYSPGSDFIAVENDFVSDLIAGDLAGQPPSQLEDRALLFEGFLQFRHEAAMRLYRGQYSLLGSYELCKLKWDLDVGSYYNLWLSPYLCDQHLEPGWVRGQLAQRPLVLKTLDNFRVLFGEVEAQLRAERGYYRRNLGEYSEGRDGLAPFMTRVGHRRASRETLSAATDLFNATRSRALALLGRDTAVEPESIGFFSGATPLL